MESQPRRQSVVELAAMDAMHRRLSTRWSVNYRPEVDDAGLENVTGEAADYETIKRRRFPALRQGDPSHAAIHFDDKSKPSVLARLGLQVTSPVATREFTTMRRTPRDTTSRPTLLKSLTASSLEELDDLSQFRASIKRRIDPCFNVSEVNVKTKPLEEQSRPSWYPVASAYQARKLIGSNKSDFLGDGAPFEADEQAKREYRRRHRAKFLGDDLRPMNPREAKEALERKVFMYSGDDHQIRVERAQIKARAALNRALYIQTHEAKRAAKRLRKHEDKAKLSKEAWKVAEKEVQAIEDSVLRRRGKKGYGKRRSVVGSPQRRRCPQ